MRLKKNIARKYKKLLETHLSDPRVYIIDQIGRAN